MEGLNYEEVVGPSHVVVEQPGEKKDFLVPCFPTRPFYLKKEISKYTKENMQADCFFSHFSHNGLINLIS